jgi:hypothetical protein
MADHSSLNDIRMMHDHAEATHNALLKLGNIADVVIACRPSHIPVPERAVRRRTTPNNGRPA